KLLQRFAGGAYCVAFSSDGRYVACGSDFEDVPIWDTTTGKQAAHLSSKSPSVRAVAFSPRGDFLVAAGDLLEVWAGSNWKQSSSRVGPLSGQAHRGPIRGLALSPDGRTLATIGSDRCVRAWQGPWLQEVFDARAPVPADRQFVPLGLAFSP